MIARKENLQMWQYKSIGNRRDRADFRLGLTWYGTHILRIYTEWLVVKKTNLRFSSPPVQPRGILSDRRTASIQVLSPSAYPEVCSWGDHTVTRASWGVVNKHSCPLPFEVLVPVLRHRVGRFLDIFLAGRRKGGRKMISWSRAWSVQ